MCRIEEYVTKLRVNLDLGSYFEQMCTKLQEVTTGCLLNHNYMYVHTHTSPHPHTRTHARKRTHVSTRISKFLLLLRIFPILGLEEVLGGDLRVRTQYTHVAIFHPPAPYFLPHHRPVSSSLSASGMRSASRGSGRTQPLNNTFSCGIGYLYIRHYEIAFHRIWDAEFLDTSIIN